MTEDAENTPGTWAIELKNHWDHFTDYTWVGFEMFVDDSLKRGHQNKIDKMKWREYLIWDLQRRHQEEVDGMDKN